MMTASLGIRDITTLVLTFSVQRHVVSRFALDNIYILVSHVTVISPLDMPVLDSSYASIFMLLIT